MVLDEFSFVRVRYSIIYKGLVLTEFSGNSLNFFKTLGK